MIKIYNFSKSTTTNNISKNSLVLFFSIIASLYINPEFYSIILFLIFLFYTAIHGIKFDDNIRMLLRPLILMLIIGSIFSLQNKMDDAIRDIWYSLKAITCIILGYSIGKQIKDSNNFLNILLKFSFLSSLIGIVSTIITGPDISINNTSQLPRAPILFSIFIPLLLFKNSGFLFKGSKLLRFLIISTLFTSFFLSLSRTAIGSMIIAIILAAWLFNSKRWVSVIILFLALTLIFLIQLLPEYDSNNITFFGKINNSISEISFTDDSDMSDAINNWRGFEAFRAYTQFINSSIISQIFGQGWGATVDLGMSIKMGESMEFQYLPILHNGYMHILTKYGILGLTLYIIFLFNITFKTHGYFKNKGSVTYAYLSTGIGLILIYTSLTITGIFNKSVIDSLLIFLGFLFGSIRPLIKNNQCTDIYRLKI